MLFLPHAPGELSAYLSSAEPVENDCQAQEKDIESVCMDWTFLWMTNSCELTVLILTLLFSPKSR